MRAKNSTKSALNIASSEFVIQISVFFLLLFPFFFYRRYNVPGSHQASLQRHSLFSYSFFFWMPYSAIIGWLGRWLANHIQKISRCSMCRMQRLLSDFFPMTTVMLSFLISRNRLMSMHLFYNLSLLQYRMVPQ